MVSARRNWSYEIQASTEASKAKKNGARTQAPQHTHTNHKDKARTTAQCKAILHSSKDTIPSFQWPGTYSPCLSLLLRMQTPGSQLRTAHCTASRIANKKLPPWVTKVKGHRLALADVTRSSRGNWRVEMKHFPYWLCILRSDEKAVLRKDADSRQRFFIEFFWQVRAEIT